MKTKQKKVLYIAIGAPNSGKTSLINFRIDAFGGTRISRDDIRFSLLKDGDNYFAHEGEVFKIFTDNIQKALDNPKGETDVYADATHLNMRARKKLLKELDLTNVEKIILLWLVAPIETLLERNKTRNAKTKVPESAIIRMLGSMDTPTRKEHPLISAIWLINENWEIFTDE